MQLDQTFEDLFGQYYPMLLAYAKGLVGDDAEDIVEDVFVELWQHQDRMELVSAYRHGSTGRCIRAR